MPTITIKTPNDPAQRFEVSPNRKTVTLGRSSKSDVKIACESVSGEHATIRKLDEGYVLRDLGSTNGTKLEGKRVSEIHLKGGQEIKLGDVILTFEPDAQSNKQGESAKEQLPPLKEEAKSEAAAKSEGRAKSKPKSEEELEPQTENDPMIWGLSLMGGGLIIVGFIVLIGMEAIRAIPDRGDNFIMGGLALIVAGLICLGSILFVTGRIKFPKLVVQFDEDEDDEDEEPRRKRKKEKKKKRKQPKDEDDSDDDEDTDDDKNSEDDDDNDDDDELGKGPKDEDKEKSKKED